jgi:hypothetical protein
VAGDAGGNCTDGLRFDENGNLATGVVGVAVRVRDNVVNVDVAAGHPEVEAHLRAEYGPLAFVSPGAVMQAFSRRDARSSQELGPVP